MPQVPLQRWTDVALKREGGTEITKGAARLYGAVLVRETEGLLKLVLTRPARVTVPGGIQCAKQDAIDATSPSSFTQARRTPAPASRSRSAAASPSTAAT